MTRCLSSQKHASKKKLKVSDQIDTDNTACVLFFPGVGSIPDFAVSHTSFRTRELAGAMQLSPGEVGGENWAPVSAASPPPSCGDDSGKNKKNTRVKCVVAHWSSRSPFAPHAYGKTRLWLFGGCLNLLRPYVSKATFECANGISAGVWREREEQDSNTSML